MSDGRVAASLQISGLLGSLVSSDCVSDDIHIADWLTVFRRLHHSSKFHRSASLTWICCKGLWHPSGCEQSVVWSSLTGGVGAPPGPHTTHQHPRSKGHCCWTREPEVQCSYHPPLPALSFITVCFQDRCGGCSSRLVHTTQRKQWAFRATAVKIRNFTWNSNYGLIYRNKH